MNKVGYGDILKKAREARNLKVETAAKDLRMDVSYIRAMEEENLELFEKSIYMKLFLKTYARYLKANEQEILTLFKSTLVENIPEPSVVKDVIKKDPVAQIIRKEEHAKEKQQEAAAGASQQASKLELSLSNKKNLIIALSAAGAVLLIILIAVIASFIGKMGGAEGKGIYQADIKPELNVYARAKSEVWMRARTDAGEEEFTLKKGQDRRWKDSQRVVLLVGDAGNVEFNVNGENIGTIGEIGEVINGLVFQAGKNWYIDKGQGFKQAKKPEPVIEPSPAESQAVPADAAAATVNAQ